MNRLSGNRAAKHDSGHIGENCFERDDRTECLKRFSADAFQPFRSRSALFREKPKPTIALDESDVGRIKRNSEYGLDSYRMPLSVVGSAERSEGLGLPKAPTPSFFRYLSSESSWSAAGFFSAAGFGAPVTVNAADFLSSSLPSSPASETSTL